MWRDGRAVIGASDAGAHLDFTAYFDYPVYVLEHAVREHGVLGLEEAVHLMTEVPARLYGLRGRGRLAEGAWGDVVVLDPDTVASGQITTRFDLPAGAGRLYAEPEGVDAVLVNGTVIVEDGKLTGERSGKVLRSARDTATA
jgi:N-acyl-D-aspartate/D-glutamate deacylase